MSLKSRIRVLERQFGADQYSNEAMEVWRLAFQGDPVAKVRFEELRAAGAYNDGYLDELLIALWASPYDSEESSSPTVTPDAISPCEVGHTRFKASSREQRS